MSRHRAADESIARLLLISGPRAAGKSTFLDQLERAALPEEVLRRIPAGAVGWPQLRASRYLLWQPWLWLRTHSGWATEANYAMHYDLIRFVRLGLSDPALSLLRVARATTVVVVRPPADLLVAQFDRRRSSRRPRAKHASRTKMLYLSDGWLENLYNGWKIAVTKEFAPLTALDWLEIEPVDIGGHSWRIRDPLDDAHLAGEGHRLDRPH